MAVERTAEQRRLTETVRQLAREHLAPGALARAHSTEYPWDVAELLAEHALLGMTLPVKDGGQGATLLDAVIAIQEIALVCPKSADVFQVGNFGAIRTIAEFAPAGLKEARLPAFVAGKELLALCMSEPGAGSAVTDLETTARIEGDEVVLDGTKLYATNSADATSFLVYARFGPGTAGIGSVLVDRTAPGLTIGPPSEFMSGERWCPLRFEGCRVPAGNVVLGEGGFKRQISGLNFERVGNAARALTAGRLAFETAKAHAVERRQFGRRLCELQGIQWKFAEMAVKLDAAQLLLERAAANAGRGLPDPYEAAVAKLAANETGFAVANESLQVMGALGYSTDSLVEYALRRTRGWMIAGGSLEILKNRIAEAVFGERFDQRR